jgi:threonine dehydrogenase-like Zn-dependent dehydrogenase
MGADLAFDPLTEDMWATTMKVTGNRGFDTVIEASGNLDSAKSAMDMVGKAGTMVYFAVYPMNFELPIKPFDLYSREITVHGVFMSPYLFPRTMAILPKLNLKPLISKVFPLSQVKEAFEEQERGQGIKILVKSSEE